MVCFGVGVALCLSLCHLTCQPSTLCWCTYASMFRFCCTIVVVVDITISGTVYQVPGGSLPYSGPLSRKAQKLYRLARITHQKTQSGSQDAIGHDLLYCTNTKIGIFHVRQEIISCTYHGCHYVRVFVRARDLLIASEYHTWY